MGCIPLKSRKLKQTCPDAQTKFHIKGQKSLEDGANRRSKDGFRKFLI
jgi:hypothetical protein